MPSLEEKGRYAFLPKQKKNYSSYVHQNVRLTGHELWKFAQWISLDPKSKKPYFVPQSASVFFIPHFKYSKVG